MTHEALDPHVKDSWDPEPEDPFWMLEAEDGEWLKNARSMLGTRDASKAIRFPTQQDAYDHPARMTPGYKWWAAIPTEHTWIDTRPPNPLQAENDALRARVAELEEALEPFAEVAEHDIGSDEADHDCFCVMKKYNRAPALIVAHFRTARAALKEPTP